MSKVLKNADKLTLNAKKKIYIKDLSIDGTKKANSNGKILLDCEELIVKDCVIENGCTAYNVFEQKGAPQFNLKTIKISNLTCDDVDLKHNAASVYCLQDNAEILISDSTFNFDVNNSNVIRLANYKNASNVKVTFNNVNWNYEDGPDKENADWDWAGLVIFQPAGSDHALTGDMTEVQTWEFVFENCSYNGTKITQNNFGQHNQALYFYNINKTGNITDPADYNIKVTFK